MSKSQVSVPAPPQRRKPTVGDRAFRSLSPNSGFGYGAADAESIASPPSGVTPPWLRDFSIVHRVLQSPGQPLDSATRAFMEPRFGQELRQGLSGIAAMEASPGALRIGWPDDHLEQEADRAAERVLQSPTPRATGEAAPGFGHDFSHVRVHVDDEADASARAVGALAYTVGNQIVFRDGHCAPETLTGQRLLAHELAHVVQSADLGVTLRRKPGPKENPELAPQVAVAAHRSAAPTTPADSSTEAAPSQGIDEYKPPESNVTYRVGDTTGSNLLMRIDAKAGGGVVFRWYGFEAGVARSGSWRDWDFLMGAAVIGGVAPVLESLGRQLPSAEWRRLWPDPVPGIMRLYEEGKLSLSDEAVLTTYRGMIRVRALALLAENEAQVDALLADFSRVKAIQDYAAGLKEASQLRDQLEQDHARIERQYQLAEEALRPQRPSRAAMQGFTPGLPKLFINMSPVSRLRVEPEEAEYARRPAPIERALDFLRGAFPLLKSLKTGEITPERVGQTISRIKSNIIVTRSDLERGRLDPWLLLPVRQGIPLGKKTAGVVDSEERSKARWAWIKGGAALAGGIALLFLPGGAIIDVLIGLAIAGEAGVEALRANKAANISLDLEEGLMTQAQAAGAAFDAILATLLAAAGAAGAGLRILRVARAFQGVRRVLPELDLAEKAWLARALSGDKELLETLTGAVARDDPAILARMRSAVRKFGDDPAALRRSLENTSAIARIPRRIVEKDAYAPIRAITDGSDIARVAEVTRMSRAEVEAAKRHFMLDEHILVDERTSQLYRGRFTADPGDGRIWRAAAEGRKLPPDELNHLKRLIRHEFGEGRILADRTIEEAFVRGELEQRLRTFLLKRLDARVVETTLKDETRPIQPFRYAHYVAHFSGYPNP